MIPPRPGALPRLAIDYTIAAVIFEVAGVNASDLGAEGGLKINYFGASDMPDGQIAESYKTADGKTKFVHHYSDAISVEINLNHVSEFSSHLIGFAFDQQQYVLDGADPGFPVAFYDPASKTSWNGIGRITKIPEQNLEKKISEQTYTLVIVGAKESLIFSGVSYATSRI